jgi:hypothetical protein
VGLIIGNAIIIYVNKIGTLFDGAKIENIFQFTRKFAVKKSLYDHKSRQAPDDGGNALTGGDPGSSPGMTGREDYCYDEKIAF